MSDKTKKAAETQVVDQHGDELIHIPKGESRLKYLATIGLVVFLLVIFVVADLFQGTMTGQGGGGSNEDVYLTWTDPVNGEEHEVRRAAFFDTARKLQMLTAFGLYSPESFQFVGEGEERPQRAETTEEDTASFLIYEDLAADMGVAVSDDEHKDLLRARFTDGAGVAQAAANARMRPAALGDLVRRLQRVQKVRSMMLGMLSIPDPNEIVSQWAADNPEFKFQIVTVKSEDFNDTAEAEVPSDDDLLAWFHELQEFEQQRYYTDPRSVAEVAYLPLDDESFDPEPLLAAYPAPDGVDLDGQANSYYSQYRITRFTVDVEPQPNEAAGEDGDGETGDGESSDGETGDGETSEGETGGENAEDGADPDGDGQEGDADDTDSASDADDDTVDPTDDGAPTKQETRIQEFTEVEEQVRREAALHAAFGAFLIDVQDRVDAGEEVDFQAEAEALGLRFEATKDEGMNRDEYIAHETWGNAQFASQLVFTQENRFIPRVNVVENGMAVARVTKKYDREEPPIEDFREELTELWVKDRAKELAIETLETMRGALAERPEDVELADWKPVLDAEELRSLAIQSGYTFVDRPWLGRGMLPEGQSFSQASNADKFVMSNRDIYDLEPGQVGAPAGSTDGAEAYLVRFEGKRDKSADEMKYEEFTRLRSSAMYDITNEFGRKVFRGDGVWLKEKAKLRFPAREAAEAKAAEEAAADDGASSES